jgi:hypothetical protein
MMVDRRGQTIAVGSWVAYNLSGGVAIGQVVAIEDKGPTGSGWRKLKKFVVSIEPDKAWKKLVSGRGYSKVAIIVNFDPHPNAPPHMVAENHVVDKIVVLL